MFTFIQDFIEKAPTRTVPKTGRPVCYKQLREYERTFHYLKEFAKNKNEPINFQDITLDFYHDFITYLQSEKTITRKTGEVIKEPGLALNTIGKKIQTLKIFLNAATDSGINTNNYAFKIANIIGITPPEMKVANNRTFSSYTLASWCISLS